MEDVSLAYLRLDMSRQMPETLFHLLLVYPKKEPKQAYPTMISAKEVA